MTVTVRVLIPAKIAEATQTTQYTANGVTTIIDKFTATNYSAAAATISVNLVTGADTAGNQNLIVKTKTLQPAGTYTFPELWVRRYCQVGLSRRLRVPHRRLIFGQMDGRLQINEQ